MVPCSQAKTVTINAANNSDANRYVDNLKWNGKQYSKNWISHSELMKGAVLDFTMSATPNKKRGTNPSDFPYSLSNDPTITAGK